MKSYKIAIIAPVPFYYHIPLYRKLSLSSQIDLTVFYCSDETLEGREVRRTYNADGKITNHNYLLEGYKYIFFKNYSPAPSFLNWPFGLINPGVVRKIRRGKYDAVVLQSWTNVTWWIAFFACLLFRIRIFFMTDSDVLSETSKSGLKVWFKKRLLGGFVFKLADGFLTSGTANENFYRFYNVPQEKMARVPFSWGYEELLKKSRRLLYQREEIRQSMGIKQDEFVVLYVGRLAEEKRPISVLRAYEDADLGSKKLFVVGGGPMKAEFEKYIRDAKIENVNFIGFVTHGKTGDYYAAADVLILPSKHETWGIVVNEAMCFSLPVITSDRVGASEDLIKDGYNGFVVPFEDIKRFSSAIERLAKMTEGEKNLFRQRSRKIIQEWISSADPVRQILKLLKR